MSEARLTTRNARSALVPGVHWRALDQEISLGYRKCQKGGRWLVRWYVGDKKYTQRKLGVADDVVGEGTFSYADACKAARNLVEQSRKMEAAGEPVDVPTVQQAVEEYISDRDKKASARAGRSIRSGASSTLGRHLLSDKKLSAIALNDLTESDIAKWVKKLDPKLKGTTRQRIINNAKAAFNRVHRRLRKVLPADFGEIIRFGMKPDSLAESNESPARDNQILTDEQVRDILAAAAEEDVDGDLARLVALLAATGARFSQVVRLHVRDVQFDRSRIMMPCSRKGRGKIDSFTPIPLGMDILEQLRPVVEGRADTERLLVRWRHKQIGVGQWERVSRGPWQAASEMLRPWKRVCDAAGLAGTVPYALRHSSIVRALRFGLPIRLVAALHDTSVTMIERHYGRWIADGLEELAARAVIPLASAPRLKKAA